jgi:AraC-like DNA-binding protein
MHTFKEQTGYTIGSYLSTKRLLYAKELIVAGKPITEVCFTCGFRNYSTFSRAYKKSFGESPRDYRQSLS